MNRSHQTMSLRSIFRSREREDSLSLEDLAGVSSPAVKSEEEQDAGLAAAMSITRLFLPDKHRHIHHSGDGEEERPEGDEDDGKWDEQRLRKVLEKVNKMRAEHDEKVRKQQLRIDDLQRENAELRARLRRALNETEDRHAMSEYATEAIPTSVVDSTYVLKLQSQLCKALHKVGMLSNQIELMESQKTEKVKELQTQLVEQGNESFRAEVGHMNDLLEMEKEMENLKEEHESESSLQQGTIAKIEVELEPERSLRCDAMSYAHKVKEKRLYRRGHRSKRRSDATEITSNPSVGCLGVDSEGGSDEQVKEPVEEPLVYEEPLRTESDVTEDDNGNDEDRSEGRMAAKGYVDDAALQEEQDLQSQLQASMRKIEELRATVSKQRRTIAQVALDHREKAEGAGVGRTPTLSSEDSAEVISSSHGV